MLKHLNNSFATAIIFALFAGIAKGDIATIPCHTIVFCIFFILFRIKTYIEDYAHFKEYVAGEGNDSPRFLLALFVAISTWCLWALSGYMVVSNERASGVFMTLSLCMSTVWVVISLIHAGHPKNDDEKKRLKRRLWWLLINSALGSILIAHIVHPELSEPKKVTLMSLLVCIVIGDFWGSWGNKKLTFD